MSGTYAPIMEKFRMMVPTEQLCKLTCSGKSCKHCSPDLPDDKTVVKGLDAQWVTDHILACSRPNTRRIKEFKIIEQFRSLGINSILNVQEVGEHAECGDPLDKESGFSYNPADFMQNGVFFYNYPMPDFSVPASPAVALDILRVVQYAVSQGKIAVHCHAGRGRTGLMIACYLIYNDRLSPAEAITYVRRHRSGSIQTQGQVDFILEFDRFLRRIRSVFAVPQDSSAAESSTVEEFTVEQFLGRQSLLIKGNDISVLRHVPKILFVLIRRILQLVGVKFALRKRYSDLLLEYSEEKDTGSDMKASLLALLRPYTLGMDSRKTHVRSNDSAEQAELLEIKQRMNQQPDSAYERLCKEKRVAILASLLWSWLDHLSEPVLRFRDVDTVSRSSLRSANSKLRALEKCQKHTFVLFAAFLKALGLKAGALQLNSQSEESQLLDVLALRCLTHLTQSRFHVDLADFIRSRYASLLDTSRGGNETARSTTPLSLSTSFAWSSSYDDANNNCSESNQPFMWTSNAYRLRTGHKYRLLALLFDAVRELKICAPDCSQLSDSSVLVDTKSLQKPNSASQDS